MSDLNYFLAFGAGFLSFISPCCLPLYPAFLSYITGVSIDEVKSEKVMLRRRSLLHTLFFLIGFSLIFIAIGFGTSFVGKFFIEYQDAIRQIGAILIIFFGFMILGVFQPSFLMGEKRLQFKNRPAGFFGSILIGMGFAAGWTPCTGPILSACHHTCQQQARVRCDLHDCVCIRFCYPIFCSFLFHHKNGLDQKASAAHYENWRDYYDRGRNLAVL